MMLNSIRSLSNPTRYNLLSKYIKPNKTPHKHHSTTTTTTSKEELRMARKSKASNSGQSTNPNISQEKKSTSILPWMLGSSLVLTTGVISYLIYDIKKHPKGYFGKLYDNSELQKAVNYMFSSIQILYEPESDQLLPDWGSLPFYAGVPPGVPAPPLLVIDVERTLIASVHDSVHGWRHVKRPGVDKFLKALGPYYEIVLFSENDLGYVQEVLDAIDKDNVTHKFGCTAAEMRGTSVLKRLDNMNRDLHRIILIDDSTDSSQLFPRNTLIVPPFDDVNNRSDRVLEDLIPLLQAFVHDGVVDFRETIDDLGTHEATEASAEYRMRVAQRKQEEERRRNIGLGGLIRGKSNTTNTTEDGFEVRSSVLSASQIIGVSPKDLAINAAYEAANVNNKTKNYFNKDKPEPSNIKKKGYLFDLLDKETKNVEEMKQLKNQKMQEIHQQRETAKFANNNTNNTSSIN